MIEAVETPDSSRSVNVSSVSSPDRGASGCWLTLCWKYAMTLPTRAPMICRHATAAPTRVRSRSSAPSMLHVTSLVRVLDLFGGCIYKDYRSGTIQTQFVIVLSL